MSDETKLSKPYVRQATREDCLVLAKNLRPEDLEELTYSSGLTPEQSLLFGLSTSDHTWSVVWGDEIVAIFGVGGVEGVVGFPWMLASPSLTKIRKSFLKECSRVVEGMLEKYPNLENYVWAGNTVHVQWLRWLGFTLEPAEPLGFGGEPFHRFFMKDNYVRTTRTRSGHPSHHGD